MVRESRGVRPTKVALLCRGRAGVFWALGGFLVFQLLFHYPLSGWFPQLHDMEYGSKLNNLRAKLRGKVPEQPFILAFGSSLTDMGLRPDVLTSCQPRAPHGPLVYNYGLNSSLILVHSLCLHRLLAEKIRPDWILLEVWPLFFLDRASTDPKRIDHLTINRLQRQDLSFMARFHRDPQRLHYDWWEGQCWPWYLRRHMLMNWLLPTWVTKTHRVDELWQHTDSWGWESHPSFLEKCKPIYNGPEWAETLRKSVEDLYSCPINQDLHTALREFIELCQREKIGVVLIWVPESTHHRNAYSSALTQRIARWHARLREETGVLMVNARDWLADPDFIDGAHVTPEGARHYTQRLEAEVIQPIATGTLRPSWPIDRLTTVSKSAAE